MKRKNPTFSVLMSVYKNDNPNFLKLALESIYENQTKKPDEIVIVFDGPLTKELEKVLDDFKKKKDRIVKYYPQKENKGLGEALRIGSEKCTCDYILRMDSDDVSVPERFKIQSDYMIKHPEIDVLGGDIAEFDTDPYEPDKRIRSCPEKLEDIIQMGKKRNPMNHVTVCIKREALIDSGGYLTLKFLEDYYLWLRMIINKKQLANIKETLVYVRVGNGFESRRSTKEHIKGWKYLQSLMLENELINKNQAIKNMVYINIFSRTPKRIKKFIYNHFLRNVQKNNGKYLIEMKKGNEQSDIKELQRAILKIVLYFDDFCKKNNIKYFLMGGSALGAVRHKGFIPWDDDLDVFLDYENYQKLLKISENLNNDRYHFQRQNTKEQPYYYSKLRDSTTTYLDDYSVKHKDTNQGIFIDIMCLVNAPNGKIRKKIQYYEAALLKAKAVKRYGYTTNSLKKKVELFIANIVINKLTENYIYKKVCRYSYNTPEVAHLFGRAKFDNSFYKRKWFTKQIYTSFENAKLPIPNGSNEYLRTRYGKNYMEIPSKKVRKEYEQHAKYWSTTKSYTEYDWDKDDE